MSSVFIAGPIDFQGLEEIVAYRTGLRDAVADRGLTPVDQYSELLDRLTECETDERGTAAVFGDLSSLPQTPYLEAIRQAVAATSAEAVAESPSLVPEHASPGTVADIVDYDLRLVAQSDVFLAYLPRPSCGTMAELLHAREQGLPTVVVSERPPLFVQHFADRVRGDIDDAAEACAALAPEH